MANDWQRLAMAKHGLPAVFDSAAPTLQELRCVCITLSQRLSEHGPIPGQRLAEAGHG
jgi:hypothetical protein